MQLSTLCLKYPFSPPASSEVRENSLPVASALSVWGMGADEQMLATAFLPVDYSERFRCPPQRCLAPAGPLHRQPWWCFLIPAFSPSLSPRDYQPINCLHWVLVSGSALGEQDLLLLDVRTLLSREEEVDTSNLCFFCESTKWASTERGPWRLLRGCSFHIQAL